ncbi:MAG: hypothetical protein WC917_00460 [Bacilli bacterium]|jgi:hypothetical protein
MTTSNTTDFSITADDCIQAALEDINVIGEGDSVSAYDYGIAKNRLNLMLKGWQNQAEHLWVRQKVVLFLQTNQPSYEISLTSADHFTADTIRTTTTTANAILGATTLAVTSSAGFLVNDYIGIQLDAGTMFWSTVANVPTGTSIQINNALPSVASSGVYVFGYTNKITNVFNAYSATRRLISSNIDVPLLYVSYTDYTNMPNKFSLGTPNMWSYDRQTDKFVINIWQNPSSVQYYINFVVDKKIQDIDFTTDSFDFPQEWSAAIVSNLAVRLAPTYGKAQGENFAQLKEQAKEDLVWALENDNELGSIYIMPSRDGVRGR